MSGKKSGRREADERVNENLDTVESGGGESEISGLRDELRVLRS